MFHHGYKNHSVYDVYSKSRCLFWDPYKTLNAKWAPCRIFECLTWWYVKKPLGFERLNYTQQQIGPATCYTGRTFPNFSCSTCELERMLSTSVISQQIQIHKYAQSILFFTNMFQSLLWPPHTSSTCEYKSLARPGRKQARKHVRDARDFNNIETQAAIKSPPLARQGAEGNTPFWQKHLVVSILVGLRMYQHPSTFVRS